MTTETNSESVCDICDFPKDLDCDAAELEGNASLIAAAPDLLEACKAYLDAMERYGHPDKTDRLMRKAIAKAEGVQRSRSPGRE